MTSYTPWGFAEHIVEIAPGIVSYSTPSHGSIHLLDERIASAQLRTEATQKGRGL